MFLLSPFQRFHDCRILQESGRLFKREQMGVELLDKAVRDGIERRPCLTEAAGVIVRQGQELESLCQIVDFGGGNFQHSFSPLAHPDQY